MREENRLHVAPCAAADGHDTVRMGIVEEATPEDLADCVRCHVEDVEDKRGLVTWGRLFVHDVFRLYRDTAVSQVEDRRCSRKVHGRRVGRRWRRGNLSA